MLSVQNLDGTGKRKSYCELTRHTHEQCDSKGDYAMKNSDGKGRGRQTPLLRSILITTLIFLPMITTTKIQAQEESISMDISAADRVAAAYSSSNFRYHVLPANNQAGKAALGAGSLGTSATKPPRTAAVPAATIPSVPAPGFYPEDLVYFGGKVLTSVTSHPVYVNLASCGGTVAKCWGDPVRFLSDLSNSTFIHLTDQYVGVTDNNRYPPGTAVSTTVPLFADNVVGQDEILAIVHAAATKLGAGYAHTYHVFLPKGVDTCFDLSSVCYSPDFPPSFVFCAYHGSVVFNDIGHVLLSVEPYQNVPGCQSAPPDPNGILADSTNSVLSHEMVESITDPDPAGPGAQGITAWVNASSLLAFGAEIGDECEPVGGNGQFFDSRVILNGHPYKMQLEYSNKYHACAGAP
jgi:hypothetical protein